jgi:hypothetical protein
MGNGHGGYSGQVRGQSLGDSTQGTDTGRNGSSQEEGEGTSGLDAGLKGREEIAGLTRSRAKAMDPAIYPTIIEEIPT